MLHPVELSVDCATERLQVAIDQVVLWETPYTVTISGSCNENVHIYKSNLHIKGKTGTSTDKILGTVTVDDARGVKLDNITVANTVLFTNASSGTIVSSIIRPSSPFTTTVTPSDVALTVSHGSYVHLDHGLVMAESSNHQGLAVYVQNGSSLYGQDSEIYCGSCRGALYAKNATVRTEKTNIIFNGISNFPTRRYNRFAVYANIGSKLEIKDGEQGSGSILGDLQASESAHIRVMDTGFSGSVHAANMSSIQLYANNSEQYPEKVPDATAFRNSYIGMWMNSGANYASHSLATKFKRISVSEGSQIVFGGFRLSDSVTGKSIAVDNRSFLQFDTDGGAITLDDFQLDRFSVVSGDITFTGMPAGYYCRSSNMELSGSIASTIKSEHPSCY